MGKAKLTVVLPRHECCAGASAAEKAHLLPVAPAVAAVLPRSMLVRHNSFAYLHAAQDLGASLHQEMMIKNKKHGIKILQLVMYSSTTHTSTHVVLHSACSDCSVEF